MATRGTCHLCGNLTWLSFEHVPPRAAFNSRPVTRLPLQRFLESRSFSELEGMRGQQSQRGAGAFTLCEPCNNNTGAWYGPEYVDWAWQGLRLLTQASVAPSLSFIVRVFPLRIIPAVRLRACARRLPVTGSSDDRHHLLRPLRLSGSGGAGIETSRPARHLGLSRRL